jgi:hypothetical protein
LSKERNRTVNLVCIPPVVGVTQTWFGVDGFRVARRDRAVAGAGVGAGIMRIG